MSTFRREDQLRLRGVKQPTLQRYLEQTHVFRVWARAHRKSLATPDSVDVAMCQYLLELYEDGAHSWEGSYVIYGYQFLYNRKSDRDFLVGAKKALKAWRKRCPPAMRLPVPEEIIFALGTKLIEQNHLNTAIAMALQFHTYMRPSEVITLQHHQLCPPVKGGMHAYDQWAVILAPQDLKTTTKTGEVDDSILIDNRICPWLSQVLSLLHKPGSRTAVFPGLSLSKYEDHFKQAMAAMGLPLSVTPHVVRHSGPSNDFYHRRKTIKQIQKQGRWAAFKSCRRYEKSGLIMQAWSQLTLHQKSQATAAAKQFPHLVQRRASRL